jgi:hypothetical protein
MATMTKNQKAPKFENRVRFNWGYHDAAQAVREGWNTAEMNFGFARGGVLKITCVKDVLEQHFDREYAQGWQQGYFDSEDGMYDANGQNSEAAWQRCKVAGLVAE